MSLLTSLTAPSFLNILRYLSLSDIKHLTLTCKTLHQKIWKEISSSYEAVRDFDCWTNSAEYKKLSTDVQKVAFIFTTVHDRVIFLKSSINKAIAEKIEYEKNGNYYAQYYSTPPRPSSMLLVAQLSFTLGKALFQKTTKTLNHWLGYTKITPIIGFDLALIEQRTNFFLACIHLRAPENEAIKWKFIEDASEWLSKQSKSENKSLYFKDYHTHSITKIPTQIADSYQPVRLSIRECSLLRTLPESRLFYVKLRDLEIYQTRGRTNFHHFPKAISQLNKLRKLTFNGQEYNGSNTQIIGIHYLKHLRILSLVSNTIKEIPKSLTELTFLKFLDLSSNPIENGLSILEKLPKLKTLYLSCILKDDEIFPTSIFNTLLRIKKLRHLKLVKNELKTWPKICILKRLMTLNLDYNPLKKIPDLLGFTNLRTLSLRQCGLTSADGLDQINHLQELILSKNKLRTLPSSLGNLKKLLLLNLEENEFEEFPNILCELKKIKILYLGYNKISLISIELLKIKCLHEIDLYDNPIKEIHREFLLSIRAPKTVIHF